MNEQNKNVPVNSDINKGLFSFTIKKKKDSNALQESSIAENVAEEKEKTEFIVGIHENKIESTEPKEEKKELVIPLISKNRWQGHESQTSNEEPPRKKVKSTQRQTKQVAAAASLNQLDNEAVKEIIKETSVYNETWEDRGKEDLNLTIPLLMVNKPPEGFETDDKLDVSIRPNVAEEADYETVPISSFGMAMLRGMGWNKKEGIGTSRPVEAVSRPKGQGLGADRGPGPKQQAAKGKGPEGTDEPEGFVKGAGILVTRGAHKNLYGLIEGTDEDNSRLVIKLAINGQVITLSQFNAQAVSKSEYKKYAKDLGKFSRGHNELKKREARKDDERDSNTLKDKKGKANETSSSSYRDDDLPASDSSRHRDRKHNRDHPQEPRLKRENRSSNSQSSKDTERTTYRDKEKSSERPGDKERRRKDDRDRNDDKKSRYEKMEMKSENEAKKDKMRQEKKRDSLQSSSTKYWLRPDLRVRFINRTFKAGRYYNSKVRVVDVQEQDVCSCQTNEGTLLHDIHQSMLETLIPRAEPGYVMIVQGKHGGQVGLILNKDKKKCEADVQLLRDRDEIVRLSYDSICEYVGDIHLAENL
ncbi:putative G patch domain and KOW motifs-containing protein [Apostichopus japonicus]|uniref:Putative G patch domain and KOW motifs-containing protein n=1 Tax=Stichopus japonicus TaxID=307972 RepID=A0A2G8LRA0_STIJA|nr:putative G patch domain and KOW motifs-containing protein [Apostichopus japonicus]